MTPPHPFSEEDRLAHIAYDAYYESISTSVDGGDGMPANFDHLDHEREIAWRAAIRAVIAETYTG